MLGRRAAENYIVQAINSPAKAEQLSNSRDEVQRLSLWARGLDRHEQVRIDLRPYCKLSKPLRKSLEKGKLHMLKHDCVHL